jgi:asparagine synthase (glutamine-hydrolysing)
LAACPAGTGGPTFQPALAGEASQRLWVVLDGLLYNREDLLAALRPDLPEGQSDAALVLAGYRRWGEGVLDRLDGDFAFAVWDGRRDVLFAATDPFGLRPFFYAARGDLFVFGPYVRQLEALPWVGREVDDRAIVSLLVDVWDDAGATFSRNVRQLPPGHSLRARAGGMTVRRYWEPGTRPTGGCASEEDVLIRFEDLFRQAVRRRLLAAGSLGLLMSGGFDSTAVAGMVADVCRRDQPALPPPLILSGRFGDLPCDESGYIEAALRGLPFASRSVTALAAGMSIDQMRQDVCRHDAPFLNRQRPLCNELVAAVRSAGVGVLLTGLGGDELTTDYGYSADLLRSGRLRLFLRSVRHASRAEGLPLGRLLFELFREAAPEAVKWPYRQFRRLLPAGASPAAPEWLTPAAARLASAADRGRSQRSRRFPSKTAEFAWQAVTDPYTHWSNRWWVAEFAAVGVRICCPLLDRRLFEFVLGIPSRFRPCCDGVGRFKLLISRGLRRYLPRELHARDGKVFFESYNNAVFDSSFEQLRAYLFGTPEWHAEAFVSRARACLLFEAYRQGADGAGPDALARARQIEPLWRIAGLEVWLRERRSDLDPLTPYSPHEETFHG